MKKKKINKYYFIKVYNFIRINQKYILNFKFAFNRFIGKIIKIILNLLIMIKNNFINRKLFFKKN